MSKFWNKVIEGFFGSNSHYEEVALQIQAQHARQMATPLYIKSTLTYSYKLKKWFNWNEYLNIKQECIWCRYSGAPQVSCNKKHYYKDSMFANSYKSQEGINYFIEIEEGNITEVGFSLI